MRTIASTSLLALTIASVSCKTDVNLSERPLFDNGVNVFEAQVVDGLTGTLITNATVAVQVGHHVLTARNDNGFYTVYGIPFGTFRIMVSAPGFNDFRATRAFTNSNPWNSLSNGDPMVYYFNNVVVYPTGDMPSDIVVSVYDGADGAPVPNATVVASLNSMTTMVTVSDALAPSVGLLPTTIAATTDASGKATLPAGNLIMGARYLIDVFGALDTNGVYLVPTTNQTIDIGYDVQEVVTFLDRPVLTPVALSANNEDDTPDDFLEVIFPYGIVVCTTDDDHGWTNTTDVHQLTDNTDGDTVVTSPAANNPVTVTLSNHDTTIKLEYVTDNNDNGDDLYVTFIGVQVRPVGSSEDSCTSLTSVPLRNLGGGTTVDTEIFARDVPGVP